MADAQQEEFSDHLSTYNAFNKLVLLTGEAPNAAAKADVERVARGVENVRSVYNELQVGPVSAISARTNDTYITSKVKARFVDGQKFSPVQILRQHSILKWAF